MMKKIANGISTTFTMEFIHHRQGQGEMSNDNVFRILNDLRELLDGNSLLVFRVLLA